MKEILIKDFTAKRGNFLLESVNLKINENEVLAILGKTGSGKTVLLEAIAGMFRGNKGEILYDGVNVYRIRPGQRKLGLVYQDQALFPHLTVYENIVYGMKMHKVAKDIRDQETISISKKLGISHLLDRYPQTLSGGERQRVALARAIVLKPKLLLLDEPFSALDPSTKEQLYKLFKEIHKHYKCTIIFVTHDFHEAVLLSDRIAILLNGRMRAIIDADKLGETKFDEDVEIFLGRSQDGIIL